MKKQQIIIEISVREIKRLTRLITEDMVTQRHGFSTSMILFITNEINYWESQLKNEQTTNQRITKKTPRELHGSS